MILIPAKALLTFTNLTKSIRISYMRKTGFLPFYLSCVRIDWKLYLLPLNSLLMLPKYSFKMLFNVQGRMTNCCATILLILLFVADVFTDIACGVELILNDYYTCKYYDYFVKIWISQHRNSRKILQIKFKVIILQAYIIHISNKLGLCYRYVCWFGQLCWNL